MKMRVAGRWLPVAGWMAFIYALSAQPSFPDLGLSDSAKDATEVAVHFGLYAMLGFLVSRTVALNGDRSVARIAMVLAVCAAFALSDEWHQSFVPNRTADVVDWIVDLAGAVTGCLLYMRLARRLEATTVPR